METKADHANHLEINKKEKVILEIGPGIYPHIENRKDLNRNTIYVGIDNQLGAKFTDDSIKDLSIKGGGVVGDAKALPISNSSCDEVVIANVFGISGIGLGKKGYLIDYLDSNSIISEIERVIKDDGSCVVIENITPPDKDKIIKKFKLHRLHLLLDSSDHKLLSNYSVHCKESSNITPYLLKFSRKPL